MEPTTAHAIMRPSRLKPGVMRTSGVMKTALAEIRRLLGGDVLTKSDVINLMSQLRLLLESQAVKKQFPRLAMYCDWTLHPQLSRSAVAFRLMESIADVLIAHPDAPGAPGFFDAMTKAVGLGDLRSECIDASRHFGIPDKFCADPKVWTDFATVLVGILLDRPLEFPPVSNRSKGVDEVLRRIEQKWRSAFRHTLGIQRVAFVLGTGEHEGAVLWELELIPGATCIPKSVIMRGPLKRP